MTLVDEELEMICRGGDWIVYGQVCGCGGGRKRNKRFGVVSRGRGGVKETGGIIFFFQAEDGIRGLVRARGLGDGDKRQVDNVRASWSYV